MCLAIPAQITKLLPSQRAIINLGGIEREISTALLDDVVVVDDYVMVHVGYALTKLNECEARKTLDLFRQMLEQDR